MNEESVGVKTIAERLRDLRKDVGLNQVALVARVNTDPSAPILTQQTLSQWENADIPSALHVFTRVALAMGKTPNDLLLAAPHENELARTRERLPVEFADDMMSLTRLLIGMHHKAMAEGPGKSPITIFLEHAENLSPRILGRRAVPAVESPQSSPPHVQELKELVARLSDIAVREGVDSGLRAHVVAAVNTLTQRGALRTPPNSQVEAPAAKDSPGKSGKGSRDSAPQQQDHKQSRHRP